MIKALIFDLDGTLIQTEVLKARSYAKAINKITNNLVSEEEVLNSFEMLVGLSRPEVVAGLHNMFKKQFKVEWGSKTAEDIRNNIIMERLEIYNQMLNDKQLLTSHFCQFNLDLLRTAHAGKYRTMVATMSHKKEATKVIEVMGVTNLLEFLLTRDDVENGKPDPEIYLKASDLLDLKPNECLVLEDSVNGIKAGIAADMHVFAVTNSITKKSVHSCKLLDAKFIVDDPKELKVRVYDFIAAIK